MASVTWTDSHNAFWFIPLTISIAAVTLTTFNPRISVSAQSITVAFASMFNTFLYSAVTGEYYLISVLLWCGIFSLYKKQKLLLLHAVLNAAYHIYMLFALNFTDGNDMMNFILLAVFLIFIELYLTGFISSGKRTEENLRQSVITAQHAERSKSDFLANMSHEIRTPMNAIIGMCELILREDDISDVVRENCFNIQTSGRSLLSIINDILDFSKIDSGKMELINEKFNIASTLNDVINMSITRKGDKKIEIIVRVDPDIPVGLIGDEIRIRQIIINLMTNAVKFTSDGTVALRVSHTKQDYGINLMVSVADSGIGITEENLEKLFTSFQQVDTKKNRSVEGTGLGLAISKKLVNNMGGFISVTSEYGKGSEFKFVIPLKVSDGQPFITVKNPDTIKAAGYFNLAKFNNEQITEEYNKIFDEIGGQLHVEYINCTTIDELKKTISENKITHCFIGREEYIEFEDYFIGISNNIEVMVIQDRINSINLPSNIKCIYKPFYALSVASALNNENIVLNLNERRGSDIHFIAPKARILLVDDNAINLKVAAGLMRPYNMQILTAESGPAAISMLRAKDIDVVFMDHMMPEMDGVEATRIIRAEEDEYFRKVPIIALTANAIAGVRDMFIKEGFNDFLAKPIELSALDRILRNYIPSELIQSPVKQNFSGEDRRKKDVHHTDEKSSSVFNPDKGLAYAGGDEEAYIEILELFAQKGNEKHRYIGSLFEKQDWKNYVIEVHALKSTSMSIGAVKLSELAKELEAAGKSGNYRVITNKNPKLMKMYDEIIGIVGNYADEARKKLTSDSADKIADSTVLAEIGKDILDGYITKALQACSDFDGEIVVQIAEETKNYSYKNNSLQDFFGKAAKLADDFEYDAAASEIEKLKAVIDNEDI